VDRLQPRENIRELCAAFTTGLQAILGPKLHGVYIYGAAAFPDTIPSGDVDFHVILEAGLDEIEKGELWNLFDALKRGYPPLGGELDGYFILLADARQSSPPKHQLNTAIVDHSWALHREHILAGRCIVLYGPDPVEIYLPATWEELEEALYSELKFVQNNMAAYPGYSILNLCRLVYSFETRQVVLSKAQAAAWALEALPQWRQLIELAIKSYQGQATPEEQTFMQAEAPWMYSFACERIEAAGSR